MADRIIKSYSQCMLFFDLLNELNDLNETFIFEYLTNNNHILDRHNRNKPLDNIFITLSGLCNLFHLNYRTVSKCLLALEEKGFIKIYKKVKGIGWFIGFTDKAIQIKQEEAEVFNDYQIHKKEYYSTKGKSKKSDTTQTDKPETLKTNVSVLSDEDKDKKEEAFDRTKFNQELIKKLLGKKQN